VIFISTRKQGVNYRDTGGVKSDDTDPSKGVNYHDTRHLWKDRSLIDGVAYQILSIEIC
jgi:hypothetical protein